ncbi:MAG: 50S ribosomal protein L22 [Patescibacteria group bacterium]
MTKPISAKANYLRIAPRKTRALATILKGLSVNEAEGRLMLSPRRPAEALLKLIKSAVANAKNQQIEATKLFIKDIRVDQGPKSKRWLPRARGSASPLERKTSHVSLTLGIAEKDLMKRFTIKEKVKKDKEKEKKQHTHDHDQKEPEEGKKKVSDVKPKGGGIFKKVFQRKSI